MNKADLLSYIEQIINLDEFWQVNYYLRSMKKAPHGGIIHINYPNIYLKYYPFQTWTLATDEPERIPVFMTNLVETAVKLYFECGEPDLEELLQYCYNGDNWYLGFRLLHIKPEFAEQNAEIGGTFLWSVLSNNKKIVDYFDIELKYAIYSLILVLINERAYVIKDLNEILIHEQLKKPHNKYGLTLVNDIAFMRQGFRLHDSYYLYNIFIDPSIGHPSDIMPYTFRIMVDEIENMDIYMRCDEELAVPYSDMISTATDDSQKFFGITVNFADINKLIKKEIIVHYNPETGHKIIMIIKPDTDNGNLFYHIEIEELWNTEKMKEDIILATFIHAKYYPSSQAFTHIDFSVNQYDIETYRAKYSCAINNTGIPADKYSSIHYKVWCVEANTISISTWSKLVCATLDKPFRNLFLEMFN